MIKTLIVGFLLYFNFNLFSQSIYKVQPDVSSCKEGELTDAEKEKALNYVNRIRSMHGIPPVEYDYSGDKYAQKGALVTVANRALSHQPPSNWSCFSQDAYYGNENSNLFIFMSSGQSNISSEVGFINWMIDESVESLGHRRAIINPFVDKMSFGRVDGNVGGYNVTGMNFKYMDNLGANIASTNIDYVAYPQGNYDKNYFQNGWYLSFHAIGDKVNWYNNNMDYSATTISMKDSKGNIIGVNSIESDNSGGGALTNMIKWKCSDLNYYETYSVEIKNVKFNGASKNYSYTFILGDGPGGNVVMPTLLTPAQNATNVKLNQAFTWSNDDNNYIYNVQISEQSNFSSLVEDKTNFSGHSYVSTMLANEKTYYWRVQALDGGKRSSWSNVYSFTTEKYSPQTPNLISPVNKDISVRIKPYFEWEKVNDKLKYDIMVGDRATFSLKLVDEKNISSNTFNSISANLKPDKKYFWRVRSVDGTIAGDWSEIYEFTTPPLPTSISLVSPTENSTLAFYNDWNFIWERSDNATNYLLSVYELDEQGNTISSTDYNTDDIKFTLSQDKPANREKLNAWSVTAMNSDIVGVKSETRKFNITMTGVSREISTDEMNVYPNPVTNQLNIDVVDNSLLNSNYEIYDVNGNKVREGKISKTQQTIDFENFIAGTYIIIFDNSKLKYYTKVIKQ